MAKAMKAMKAMKTAMAAKASTVSLSTLRTSPLFSGASPNFRCSRRRTAPPAAALCHSAVLEEAEASEDLGRLPAPRPRMVSPAALCQPVAPGHWARWVAGASVVANHPLTCARRATQTSAPLAAAALEGVGVPAASGPALPELLKVCENTRDPNQQATLSQCGYEPVIRCRLETRKLLEADAGVEFA